MILVTTVFCASISTKDANANNEKSNYQLQAELIFNFTNHVTWLGEKPKNINLCIMGDNPVTPYLNQLLENNKNIIILRKYENDYLDNCNILFINDVYQGYLKRLLLRVQSKSILTFSNKKDFIKNGGMVQFNLRRSRVEFVLNIKKINSTNIEISQEIVAISQITE